MDFSPLTSGGDSISKNVMQAGEEEKFTAMVDNIMGVKSEIVSQSSDMSYILLTQADEIEKFAEGANNDNIAALAYIKGADGIRSELNYSRDEISKNI